MPYDRNILFIYVIVVLKERRFDRERETDLYKVLNKLWFERCTFLGPFSLFLPSFCQFFSLFYRFPPYFSLFTLSTFMHIIFVHLLSFCEFFFCHFSINVKSITFFYFVIFLKTKKRNLYLALFSSINLYDLYSLSHSHGGVYCLIVLFSFFLSLHDFTPVNSLILFLLNIWRVIFFLNICISCDEKKHF